VRPHGAKTRELQTVFASKPKRLGFIAVPRSQSGYRTYPGFNPPSKQLSAGNSDYGAFNVSVSQLAKTISYIQNQARTSSDLNFSI
jgi:hypothetical protein